MKTRESLKELISRAESNGDYFMVSELIESGFKMYMEKGPVEGYNYRNMVHYVDDAYSTYINYMKLKGKILKA